jgi:dGTPase
MHSAESQGRRRFEPPHPYRGPFQRDRDRILHSAAFRRLAGKMQVFTDDMGSYHRTRLTHTFEVASIARTLARVLRLNEDLVEALALMHDIGHPPYGHCGEDVLQECLESNGGFSHNQFALTIVEQLEERATEHPGLNLSLEVLSGQSQRADKRGKRVAATALLEVQVVDLADSIAYDAHDTDDALQLGLVALSDLEPLAIVQRAWARVTNSSERRIIDHGTPPPRLRRSLVHALIDLQVEDLLNHASDQLSRWAGQSRTALLDAGVQLAHSPLLAAERQELERFLFKEVYRHPRLLAVRRHAGARLVTLFQALAEQPARLPLRFRQRSDQVGIPAAIGEYIAGMTDRFCDRQYAALPSGPGPLADWS